MLNFIDRKPHMGPIVVYIIEFLSVSHCYFLFLRHTKHTVYDAILYFHESICHLGVVLFWFRLTAGLDKAHMHFSESGLICAKWD